MGGVGGVEHQQHQQWQTHPLRQTLTPTAPPLPRNPPTVPPPPRHRNAPTPGQVKVVVLGQDPYHGPGQAMGLSFSVPRGTRLPPSLLNIFKVGRRVVVVEEGRGAVRMLCCTAPCGSGCMGNNTPGFLLLNCFKVVGGGGGVRYR